MFVPNLTNLGLCLVIIRTRFGLYINMLTVTVTLTFDLKFNKDHLHSKTHICAKFDKPRAILCLVIIRQGLVYRPTDRPIDRPTFAKQYTRTSLKGGIIIIMTIIIIINHRCRSPQLR